jgi:hypothetical protein
MATFLAERYWPGVTPAAARAVAEAVGRGGHHGRGDGVRVIETIVAERDEVCFWYVEAGSAGDVEEAFAAADASVHRVAPARKTGTDR